MSPLDERRRLTRLPLLCGAIGPPLLIDHRRLDVDRAFAFRLWRGDPPTTPART